jgi:hypothetical protein
MRWLICLLSLLVILVPFGNASALEQVITIKPLSDKDTRYEYPEDLLKLILQKTEQTYGKAEVVRCKYIMKRERTLIALEEGEDIHVMAEAVKPGWEERLLPVRIPIRKGIQGYRTFLIHKDNQDTLSKVKTLDDLRKFPTGSGSQWSTTRVLEENGFKVVKGVDYEGLFKMLMRKRFITFGRGINETPFEFNARKDDYPDLAIEQHLALFIPLPTYFFVTPKKPELARRIEEGLIVMIYDGSFDRFFNERFGEIIADANLKKRRIFKLNNPNLGAKTPFNVQHFWYSP